VTNGYLAKRFALKNAPALAGQPSPDEAVAWIYTVLSTLDSKASALMRLNGVLIAAAAFLLGLFQRQGGTILSTTKFDAILIVWSALLSALSIALCLLVVSVRWHFLDKAKAHGATFDFGDEIEALEGESTWRQKVYRGAWLISAIASV
jgi:hypothetical protein